MRRTIVTAACLWILPGASVHGGRIETVGGEFSTDIIGIEVRDSTPVLLTSDREIPCRDVIAIHHLEKDDGIRGDTWILLPGGDHLCGTVEDPAGEEGGIRLSSYAIGMTHVPLEGLKGVLFAPRFESERAALQLRQVILAQDFRRDVVFSADGGRMEGIVEGFAKGSVRFSSKVLGEKVLLGFDRVRGVAIAQLDKQRKDGKLRESKLPFAAVLFRDGSRLSGGITISDGRLTIECEAIEAPPIPLDRVQRITFLQGRCRYLSDLDPKDVTERFWPWDPPASPKEYPFSYRRDANVLGGPLRIRGREFARGLGVHSYCRLTYPLGKAFERFQAVLGVDDVATEDNWDAELGNVVFRIELDGKVVFDSGTVTWKDRPRRVDIDVTGAETLSLEVDYGDGWASLDRADWADARLIAR